MNRPFRIRCFGSSDTMGRDAVADRSGDPPGAAGLRALRRDAATATATAATGENQTTVHADESIGAESTASTVTKLPGAILE
jgi:hypothetical protein